MSNWIEQGIAVNELYKKYLEQFQEDNSKEVKYSVIISSEANEDLQVIAEKLGINRAALSRDLIYLGIQAIKKELQKK